MRIPIIDLNLNPPTRSSLAWYGGIGAMAGVGLVEWPLAAIIVAGHLVSENSKSPAVSGAAQGAQSAG